MSLQKVSFLEPFQSSATAVNFEKPLPLPRSNSIGGGLNTLSKNVVKQQESLDELTGIIEHLKEIIGKYEFEIKQLQDDNTQRDILIRQYESKYCDIEKAINIIWNS